VTTHRTGAWSADSNRLHGIHQDTQGSCYKNWVHDAAVWTGPASGLVTSDFSSDLVLSVSICTARVYISYWMNTLVHYTCRNIAVIGRRSVTSVSVSVQLTCCTPCVAVVTCKPSSQRCCCISRLQTTPYERKWSVVTLFSTVLYVYVYFVLLYFIWIFFYFFDTL